MVGACLQVNAKHLRILTEQNKEMNLNEKKVLNVLDKALANTINRLEKVDALKHWSQQFQDLQSLDLETLWEVLEEEDAPLPIGEIAEMYFSESGDYERSLLLRCLLDDRVYFERKGDEGFQARARDKVAQIQEQLAREAQKAQARQDVVRWATQNQQADGAQPPPEGIQDFIEKFQDVAVRQQQSKAYSVVSQILQEAQIQGRPEEQALKLLIHSGVWDEDINLHLLEFDVPRHFSQDLLNSVERIEPQAEAHLEQRRDLRGLYTVTIDDAETTDIDDALSLERLDNGRVRVWVHIADPAEYIEIDSDLDREAARRFTSIYLCEGKIEMLPSQLSQHVCSLVQGEPRLALSVGVEISDGGELSQIEICESVIQVDRRMSYLEVDRELADNDVLQTLHHCAQQLQARRLERGAVEFTRPELRIKVTADKEILIKRIERDSPAQKLVSEMMILANALVAKTLGDAGVPLIYKVQDAPREILADGRPLLKRAEMSVSPGVHYGLGLEAYTQFTSPIRRYNDLVLHRQIKAWLRDGRGRYSADEIQHTIALSEQALFSAGFIQRENFRYWLLKHFQSLATPRVLAATVNSVSEEKGWVNLTAYCYDVPLPASELAGLTAGDELWVSLDQIHPRRSKLYVRRVSDPQASAQSPVQNPAQNSDAESESEPSGAAT